MQGRSLIEFPGRANRPTRKLAENRNLIAGSPAAVVAYFRSDLVLKHARSTRNVVTVARRMGVRANDVFLVVLDRLEAIEEARATKAA